MNVHTEPSTMYNSYDTYVTDLNEQSSSSLEVLVKRGASQYRYNHLLGPLEENDPILKCEEKCNEHGRV